MASSALSAWRLRLPSFLKKGGDEIDYWTRVGLLIIAATFVVAIIWSALAPLSSAVIAPGILKVDSNRKKIQHLEGGVVQEILVRDGDRVKAGQTLIRLDKTRADASRGVLRVGSDAAIAQQARLIAERSGLPFTVPGDLLARKNDPKVAEVIESQSLLYKARRASLDGQLSIIDEQIVFLQKGIEGLVAQQRAKEEQLRSLNADLDGLKALLEKGMVERTRFRNVEREISQLEGERAEHISDIAKSRANISEKELEKFQIRKNFREQVSEELR
ncbi:MAG: biotin/lipoyl-binding protein, partial [Gallionella sp.]